MLSCRNDYSPDDLKVNNSSKPSLCIDYHFLNSTCVDIHAKRGINKANFFHTEYDLLLMLGRSPGCGCFS